MQIDRIEIENFRCFEHFTAKFHKELTVIVGNNGCGKSTLLDAVSIAIGTFLTGFDDVGGYGISKDDALNKCYDMGSVVELQPQFPVAIEASGSLCGQQITWKRELHSAEGRTTIVDAKEMTSISSKLQSRIRNGEKPLLPLISYYGTGRLWAQKREKRNMGLAKFNRQMGYMDCLEAASNEKMMRKWFEKMTIQSASSGKVAPELTAVKSAIAQCFQSITGYQDVEVQFNLDTHELDIVYRDNDLVHRRYPMKSLSDGYKNTLSMVADIAYRMAVLNPWLLENVLSETTGIVLIDELETHLHVELQRKILPFLTEFFPRIQFIITTHSAYILNSISNACIYDLEKQVRFTDFSSYSVDDIAEGYLDATAFSDELQKKAKRYQERYGRTDLSDDERAERADLRMELKDAEDVLSKIEGKKVL